MYRVEWDESERTGYGTCTTGTSKLKWREFLTLQKAVEVARDLKSDVWADRSGVVVYRGNVKVWPEES